MDGTVAFYTRVQSLLPEKGIILDVGCGRGGGHADAVGTRRRLRDLRGPGRHVLGIDVDPAGERNPGLDEFRRIEGAAWPVERGSVQLLVTDYVLEHVAQPEEFFREAYRALAPSGVLCARTPNRNGYVALVGRATPNRFHAHVAERVQGRKEEDVFPTHYRCNTRRALRRGLRAAGFTDVLVQTYESEPRYLSFGAIPYFLGVLHQRYAPAAIRLVLFAFARKSASPSTHLGAVDRPVR